jgi:hypothetical protein
MNLSVLFWFYKDVNICRNRLQILRRHNPDISIFGLFGGDTSQAALFETQLAPYLNDFFVFPPGKSSEWKWYNGDLMIADWYHQRGQFMSWDTIVVVQWDMLVFGRLTQIFAKLNEGEILLSSIRAVEEVSPWWWWVNSSEPSYPAFVEHLREEFNYSAAPVCCQFVVVCLPREFLRRYTAVRPETGFIEYRVPTFAGVFGIPIRNLKEFDCWWFDDPATKDTSECDIVLTAARIKIPVSRIRAHLNRPDGSRIFHPFDRMFPINTSSAMVFLRDSLKDELHPTRFASLARRVSRKFRGS